jgi:L-alanine-DL-glutamate epimerase-like enolase superfamily enzyme
VPINEISAESYLVATDGPEADGTLQWSSTTLVLARVRAGGHVGIGYTYSAKAAAVLIDGVLKQAIEGHDVLDVSACWSAMQHAVRNLGRAGLVGTAISAVDLALWDLKAKLLQLPLATLLGRQRQQLPIYGSGGFTNYTDEQLSVQLGSWVERDGCRWVKMKIGSDASRDPHRVRLARRSIGEAGLFVDANGAYGTKQALSLSGVFAESNVLWFEEPVSSDDLPGLRFIRSHAPPMMEVAAGEYGYTLDYFRRMLEGGAVDVLQADATRCGGVTGLLRVASLCEAHHIDLSTHCAPAAHRHVACAVPRLRHLEWFHDHVRIEALLFDGAPRAQAGAITPDLSRPGLGLVLKPEAGAYRV